jgi:NADH-quinone oxidoreductase subunit J
MTPELISLTIFFILAAVAVASALGMLFARNAVHSALFLVLNFGVVAVFFLLLHAPFIALVQITVYAGAIMVLFLFVIMLLGAEMLRGQSGVLRWQPVAALVLALAFVGVMTYVFVAQGTVGAPPALPAEAAREFGGPEQVGLTLYRDYLLPFELTSILLLVAMIGAVVLTRGEVGRRAAGRAAVGEPAASAEPRA